MNTRRLLLSEFNLRIIVILTVITAFLGVAADVCLMLYTYSTNPEFPFLAGVPVFVLTAGSMLGICVIPLYMSGSGLAVCHGLHYSKSGALYLLFSAATSVAAAAAHEKMAAIIFRCVARGSTEIFSDCSFKGQQLQIATLGILLAGIIAMSLVFSHAVLRSPTLFPRAMAYLNPGVSIFLLSAVGLCLGKYAQPFIYIAPSIGAFIYSILICIVLGKRITTTVIRPK